MAQALLTELATRLHRLATRPGTHESPFPGVHLARYDVTDRRAKRRWRACLAIVAQGTKEVVLGGTTYRCAEGYYTAAPLHLPVISRIAVASPRTPFLALLVDLNPLTLAEVAAQLDDEYLRASTASVRALFRGLASESMLEAAVRLTRLLSSKDDVRVLGPLVVKELVYHLLRGTEGPAIGQFVRSGTKTQKVAQAAFLIRSNLQADLDVVALAKAAAMSRSAFFQHFKDVTSLSPIQYQKRLRLLEAQQLMVQAEQTAQTSAYRVGYQSASQFSREYTRMFGDSPSHHAARLRRAADVGASTMDEARVED
jgi:AraC-like DNA-binding protein